MLVDEIPPELSCLNAMEQKLISRVEAFMKLIVLPLGQRALAGQTIHFPADMSEVYNSLPRPLNSDGVVLLKPQRSTSATVSVQISDQTTSTSSGPESDRASTSTNSACANTAQSSTSISTRNLYVLSKPLVVDALRWLKDNHTLYSDVNIDESVINCNDCSDSSNEPQQRTSIEPPQFECSVVRTDHTVPNLEAIDFIRNGSYNNQVHQLPRKIIV
uniref:DUF6570 domain-containing protein n=1 Tax=Amphimedon queenslandica TaxID=400682 RepID=A0A1X7V428_AMPQE